MSKIWMVHYGGYSGRKYYKTEAAFMEAINKHHTKATVTIFEEVDQHNALDYKNNLITQREREDQLHIDLLCQKALNYLKKTYSDFPKTGFIAGGSLANLIWEQVSGNIAKVNDIDVFLFDKTIERNSNDTSNWLLPGKPDGQKLYYHKKEEVYFEDYSGLCATSQSRDFYVIEKTSHEGIYNYVNYSANKRTPQIIIDSFDINCVQVVYSIDEDKFYYTKEFIEFIQTGQLKLVNLMSPAHSAIRLVKKKHDLNAKLDELELKLCQHSLSVGMNDTNRIYFTDKYTSIFKKYESELSNYFILTEAPEIRELFKTKGLDMEIWTLNVKYNEPKDLFSLDQKSKKIFDEPNINKIWNGQKLIFYIRNIQNDQRARLVWEKLNYLFKNDDYVDSYFPEEDIEMLHRLTQVAPKTIENLKGLTLSQQVSIMKNMFDKYKEDPIVAISIMEKMRIEPDKEFDEGDILLLELSVRKEIINDVKQKAQRILNPTEKDSMNELSNDFGGVSF